MERVETWLPTVFTASVIFYICNWVLFHPVMEVLWSLEEPPAWLHDLSLWMDFFYHPLYAPSDSDNSREFWPRPFSNWLSVVVIFTLWALPDSIAEIRPNLFDPLIADEDDDDKGLYVVLQSS